MNFLPETLPVPAILAALFLFITVLVVLRFRSGAAKRYPKDIAVGSGTEMGFFRTPDGTPNPAAWTTALFSGGFVLLVLWWQIRLAGSALFCDEAETITGIRMLCSGKRLYSEIFSQHGPLIFFLGAPVELIAFKNVFAYRVFVILCEWLLVFAIYFSPLFAKRSVYFKLGVCAAFVFPSVLFLNFHMIYLYTFQYHTMGAFFLTAALAQYVLPSILPSDARPNRFQTALGTVLLVCLPFLAYSYGPTAVLLYLCSFRKEFWRTAVIAPAAALAVNLMLISAFASVPWYLATHFYLNQEFLAPTSFLKILRTMFAVYPKLAIANVCFFLSSAVLILRGGWRMPLRISGLLIFPFLCAFRDSGYFHMLPLYLTTFLLLILVLHSLSENMQVSEKAQYRILLFLLVCAGVSLISARDKVKLEPEMPTYHPFAGLCKILTEPGDKILCYSFRPDLYLLADRLPAIPDYFFLHFQYLYYQKPFHSLARNIPADLEKARPKMIYLDRWPGSDKHARWDDIGREIDAVLLKNYIPLDDHIFVLRSLADESGISRWAAFRKTAYPGRFTAPFSPECAVPVTFQHPDSGTDAAVQRISFLMFADTPEGKNIRIELILTDKDGKKYTVPLPLPPNLGYFMMTADVPPGAYVGGEIRASAPTGISLIEKKDPETGEYFTATVRHRTDGKFIVSPCFINPAL